MKSTPLLIRLFFLFLCASAGLAQCRRKAEPSLYYLPNHFVGDVLIIFGQPTGARVEYRGNTRLYRIPANGVLRTQFKPNYGLHPPDQFYYVNSQGKPVKSVPYFNTVSEAASAYHSSDTLCLHALPFKDAETQKTNYKSFIVGPMGDSEALHEARENTLRRFR